MRGFLPAYELLEPKDLKHSLQLIAQGVLPFAGGTDLMVQFEAGKLPKAKYVSLWNLRELKGIEIQSDAITIGALTTYSELRENTFISKSFPNLVAAARETGAIAIQNRGTIGGNIANSSPAADTPPALLCYDTEIELISESGTRWVAYDKFHTGYKTSLKQKNELISRVRLKLPERSAIHFYRKIGTRKAQAITKVGMAAVFLNDNGILKDVRLAFSSISPQPLRCVKTETVLRGQKLTSKIVADAQKTLSQEITPIDDIRSSQEYRSIVAQNILAFALKNMNSELAPNNLVSGH